MKHKFLLLGLLLALSCSDDDADDSSLYKESGYLISSINESTGGFTYYAGHIETLPGSTAVDMTTKSTYNFFYPLTRWKNFVFGNSLTGDSELAKIAVDKDGRLVEVGKFPLLAGAGRARIINDDLGVYSIIGDTPMLGTFNPGTMEKLSEIDMSNAKSFEGNERNYYATIIYRSQDNRLFLALMTDDFDTGQFYDDTNVYVEVVNLTTKQWEKTIVFEGATYPITADNEENHVVDEDGNIYIFTQGSYGLDGNLGPAAPAYARPQILKISANTTEAADYRFNPVDEFGQQNLLVQLMLGAIYDSDGIAYTCISAQSESNRILELVQKMANGTITEEEYFELRTAVFYSEAQRWVKLDLNAKTVAAIEDMPLTAAFGYPNTYRYDGKLYFQYNTASAGTTGFFEYDPATGSAQKAMTIVNGGIATDLIRLEND